MDQWLGEVRSTTAAEPNSSVDNSESTIGEHPAESRLAVAKTRSEARSHAENALEQFRQSSRATEVQYCMYPVECSSELLAELAGQAGKAELPPIHLSLIHI